MQSPLARGGIVCETFGLGIVEPNHPSQFTVGGISKQRPPKHEPNSIDQYRRCQHGGLGEGPWRFRR